MVDRELSSFFLNLEWNKGTFLSYALLCYAIPFTLALHALLKLPSCSIVQLQLHPQLAIKILIIFSNRMGPYFEEGVHHIR